MLRSAMAFLFLANAVLAQQDSVPQFTVKRQIVEAPPITVEKTEDRIVLRMPDGIRAEAARADRVRTSLPFSSATPVMESAQNLFLDSC